MKSKADLQVELEQERAKFDAWREEAQQRGGKLIAYVEELEQQVKDDTHAWAAISALVERAERAEVELGQARRRIAELEAPAP